MTEQHAVIARPPTEVVSFEELRKQTTRLNEFYKNLMQKGTDYDTIPGTPKPTLLKPGAELLRLWTGIRVEVEINAQREDWEKGVFAYVIKCRGYAPTGELAGEGIGSCTSLESKYRFRWVGDKELPPNVDKETLPKKWMKTRTGGSFPLFRVENDQGQDQANTILKMAKKRAFVDLMLTITGASRIFTQDVEDMDIGADMPPARDPSVTKPTAKAHAPTPEAKTEKEGEAKVASDDKNEHARWQNFAKLCEDRSWMLNTREGQSSLLEWCREHFNGHTWPEMSVDEQVDAISKMREIAEKEQA